METKTGKEIPLCLESIQWAKKENRVFLRQALEARLINLYYVCEKYNEALDLGMWVSTKKCDKKMGYFWCLTYIPQIIFSLARHSLDTSARAETVGRQAPARWSAVDGE